MKTCIQKLNNFSQWNITADSQTFLRGWKVLYCWSFYEKNVFISERQTSWCAFLSYHSTTPKIYWMRWFWKKRNKNKGEPEQNIFLSWYRAHMTLNNSCSKVNPSKYELTSELAHLQPSQNIRKRDPKTKTSLYSDVWGRSWDHTLLPLSKGHKVLGKKSPSGGTYDTGVQNIR